MKQLISLRNHERYPKKENKTRFRELRKPLKQTNRGGLY